jgi:hypothetical protein
MRRYTNTEVNQAKDARDPMDRLVCPTSKVMIGKSKCLTTIRDVRNDDSNFSSLLILCVSFCVSRVNFHPESTVTGNTSPCEQFTGRKLNSI